MHETLLEAANILDVSEIEVLRRAFLSWHAKEASMEELERTLSASLKNETLPHWAQHYAREVIEEFEQQYNKSCQCISLFFMLLTAGRRFRYLKSKSGTMAF